MQPTNSPSIDQVMAALKRKPRGSKRYVIWQVNEQLQPAGLEFDVTGDSMRELVEDFSVHVGGRPSITHKSIYVDNRIQWCCRLVG